MRRGYALQNGQKLVFCNGLYNLSCFQLFLNINTNVIIRHTIRSFERFALDNGVCANGNLLNINTTAVIYQITVLNTYFLMEYSFCVVFNFFLIPTKWYNRFQKMYFWAICDWKLGLCRLQHFLNINNNVIVYRITVKNLCFTMDNSICVNFNLSQH